MKNSQGDARLMSGASRLISFEEYDKIEKEKIIQELRDWCIDTEAVWNSIKNIFISIRENLGEHVEEKPVIYDDLIEIRSIIGEIKIDDIILRIKPKKLKETEINAMLGGIAEFLRVLPLRMRFRVFLEFLSPLLNLHTIDRILKFSEFLEKISHGILHDYLPLVALDRFVIGPMIVGKVDMVRTIKIFWRNFCFVSKRRRISLNYPPLVLLAFFNNCIAEDLTRYKENLDEHSMEYVKQRIRRHSTLLDQYPLSHVRTLFSEYNFWDRTLISRILGATMDPIWRKLYALWIAYIEELSMYEKIPSRIDELYNSRILIPMSKIYEFYVFYKVAEALSKIINTKLDASRMELSKDLKSITIDLDSVRIYYNRSFKFYSLSGIIDKKYRPDIVIESADKTIIIDAKYKELGNIDSPDIHRLLSYIKDFESRGYGKVHGMFAVLDMGGEYKHRLWKDRQYSIIEFRPNNDYYRRLYDHLEELLVS